MKVKCTNKKCFHLWNYKGKSKGYISCPKCHFRILLRKALLSESERKKLFPLLKPSKKAQRSPVIKETKKVNVLPSKIGDVNMLDGNIPSREELTHLE